MGIKMSKTLSKDIDLSQNELDELSGLIGKYLPNTEIWAYGSRIKHTSTPKSDLDLVAITNKDNSRSIYDLKEAFEESNLPFRVDLFIWDEIPDEFKSNIKNEHIVLIDKQKS